MLERTYFHTFGAGGLSVERLPNESCTLVETPTGRLMVTCFQGWARFKLEMNTKMFLKVGAVTRISEYISYKSVGDYWRAKEFSDKITHEELMLNQIEGWLARGEISGQGCEEAVWALLWHSLNHVAGLATDVAEFCPDWIKGLELEQVKP